MLIKYKKKTFLFKLKIFWFLNFLKMSEIIKNKEWKYNNVKLIIYITISITLGLALIGGIIALAYAGTGLFLNLKRFFQFPHL